MPVLDVAALRIFPGPPRNFRSALPPPRRRTDRSRVRPRSFAATPQRLRKSSTDKAFRVADISQLGLLEGTARAAYDSCTAIVVAAVLFFR